jgi:hypothetical protein
MFGPPILYLSTRRRWVVSFMPGPLYPRGKYPRYTLDRKLGEPKTDLEAVMKGNITAIDRNESRFFDRSSRNLVAVIF